VGEVATPVGVAEPAPSLQPRLLARDLSDLVAHIRRRVPGVALSTDMISGFCGETADEHADTVSLMRAVAFEQAFMFAFSMREKTPEHRRYTDDVKKARLAEVIDILIEDRSDQEWTGRSDRNRKVIDGERAAAAARLAQCRRGAAPLGGD
jgi:tRNA A37 methylthiotransferase MiaB